MVGGGGKMHTRVPLTALFVDDARMRVDDIVRALERVDN